MDTTELDVLWADVDKSSIISGIGVSEGALVVRFKNGDVYLYPGLAGHYETMLGAESVGKYFHKEIRHQKFRTLPKGG